MRNRTTHFVLGLSFGAIEINGQKGNFLLQVSLQLPVLCVNSDVVSEDKVYMTIHIVSPGI